MELRKANQSFGPSKPRVAFITTPKFRELHKDKLTDFVASHFAWLVENTDLWVTANTFNAIAQIVSTLEQQQDEKPLSTALVNTTKLSAGAVGIVAVTHELIEGRLAAVLHLSHWQDVNTYIRTYSFTVAHK